MSSTATSSTTQAPSLRYAWYVVFVLMIAYVSSFIDRQILSLLVKPMKRDLQINDFEMSLLMGLSFAIFYTLLGIPIGRLADRYSRKRIIIISIALWSLMTALCGITKNYTQLFLARVGVGVGEAGLTPPAYSMITDYFPPEKLSLAMSIYSMGIYIGSGLALVIAGLAIKLASVQEMWALPIVGEIYPWQMVFFIIGLPGLLIAALVFTIREPLRRNRLAQSETVVQQNTLSLEQVLAYIRQNGQAFFGISFAMAFTSMSAYGTTGWYPSMLQRTYGWTEVQAGLAYGGVITLCCTLGILAGGILADRLKRKHGAIANLQVCMYAFVGLLITGWWYTLMPSGQSSILAITISCFLIASPLGAAGAAIQEMMPNQMRGLATAIYFFVLNIIALGLGPTAVAALTDFVFQDEKAVRYSLLTVTIVGNGLALLSMWAAFRAYPKSLERLQVFLNKGNA